MNMGKRKYRMVLDSEKDLFFIEKKINLFLFEYWSRKYLWNKKEQCYYTSEAKLARKIVNILNGIYEIEN
jgi:hypothetical protein